MASQSSNFKTLRNGRKAVMQTVKTINNQVLDSTDVLIEETVNSGLKYQKLATKTIKKAEPLMDRQVDIFFDTVEAVYGQVQEGNKRFQKLLGITKTVKSAKATASKTLKVAGDKFEKNFEFASKTLKNVAERVEDNIEKLGSTIKVSTEKIENDTKTIAKKARKTATTKAKTVKKAVTAAKKTVKKTATKAKRKVATAKK